MRSIIHSSSPSSHPIFLKTKPITIQPPTQLVVFPPSFAVIFQRKNHPSSCWSPGYEYMSDSLGRCVLVDHGAMFPEGTINLANAQRGANGFWELANLWQGYCHLAMVGVIGVVGVVWGGWGGWGWGLGRDFGMESPHFSIFFG